jgi:hypothetical protein
MRDWRLPELDIKVVGEMRWNLWTVNDDETRHVGNGSRVTSNVIHESSWAEENCRIAFVECVALLQAEKTAVLHIVDSLGGNVTLLQESYTVGYATT